MLYVLLPFVMYLPTLLRNTSMGDVTNEEERNTPGDEYHYTMK